MNSNTQKLIEEHILKANSLHNQKNGKGYTAVIDGKSVKSSNVNDIADKLYIQTVSNYNAEQWFADINKDMVNEAHSQGKSNKEIWIKNLVVAVNGYLSAKAEYRDTHTELSIASAFNSMKYALGFTPEDDINDADIKLIEGVVYCETDDLFYFKDDNSYALLGDIHEMTTRNSKALGRLYGFLADCFLRKTGREFKFWHEMFEICNNATSDYISARRQIDELIKQGHKDGKQKVTILGEDIEIYKVLHIFDTDMIPPDWNNSLCDYYAKVLVNKLLPATLFNRKLCTLNYETMDERGEYFKRFALTFPASGKVPFNEYLLKLFECYDLVVRNIPHIETIPHIISDDNTPAKYYIDLDWKKKLENQYKFDDCKILKTFLQPYTTEEKLAIMGWVYTVLHPQYGDTINMLFKTGGGSFKTNYYCAMIQKLLCKMYNVKNNDCSFVIMKDNWVKDRFLLEQANRGVSMAAFINNDECTMECVDEFKNFSGGGKNGMDYSKRTMRENPTQMKIYGKWLFTTNNDFLINDDSGAYDRRLFIIDRMDVKKLTPPYRQNEFYDELEREMLAFYECAEKCYKQIQKTHLTLLNYVTDPNISISKNLKKAYNEEDKVWIYYKLTEELYSSNDTDRLKMPTTQFNIEAKTLCEENDVNFSGFKKWCKGNAKNFCVDEIVWNTPRYIGGKSTKVHILPKLTKKYIPNIKNDDKNDGNNNVDLKSVF